MEGSGRKFTESSCIDTNGDDLLSLAIILRHMELLQMHYFVAEQNTFADRRRHNM